MSRYLSNKVKCLVCEEVIESYHIHDFKYCTCKSIAVDGGRDYLRRISSGKWEELSVLDNSDHETRINNLKWGVNYDKDMNRLPETKWTLIKDLNKDHIEAILKGNYCNEPIYLETFTNELKLRED